MARVPDLRPVLRAARPEDRSPSPTSSSTAAATRSSSSATSPVRLPTEYGEFQAIAFREKLTGKHHLALVHGDVDGADDVLVRVHSECLTGDVFHSLRCDCGDQLDTALAPDRRRGARRAPLHGAGGPRHRAAEQAQGLRAPGAGPRHRRRQPRARLRRRRARVGDRQPDPRRPRADHDPPPDQQPEEGLRARRRTACASTEQVPIEVAPNEENLRYLQAKREKLGHRLHHQDLKFEPDGPNER